MADHLIAGLHCGEATDLAAGFVLGALEPDEMEAVRAHLATCPEAHAEFDELGAVVPALLISAEPAEPSPALRTRILDAARLDRAADPAAASPSSAADTVPPSERLPGPGLLERLGLRLGGPRPAWTVAGIAALLVVVLGTWNLQLRGQVDDLAAYRAGVVAVLDAASQPGSQLAVLTAPKGSSLATGLAAVRSDSSVEIAMRGLAPTSGTQVYEAWVIAGTNPPVPIGGFQVGSSGSATFSSAGGAWAQSIVVALTLEPGPGATSPTLPIIASGAAQATPG